MIQPKYFSAAELDTLKPPTQPDGIPEQVRIN